MADGREIAEAVVESFSQLYPDIRLNHDEWNTLKEMIEREVEGKGDGARDLLECPLYNKRLPQA